MPSQSVFSLTRPSTGKSVLTSSNTTNLGTPRMNRSTTNAAAAPSTSPIREREAEAFDTASASSSKLDAVAAWRSSVIKFEVALRELTAVGAKVQPTTERIDTVLELYDGFIEASPHIATILKLFRLEFCRAIFKPFHPGGARGFGEPGHRSEIGQPYFDLVDNFAKEKAILEAELDAVESDSSIEALKKQVASKQSLVAFYEHEVARLTKENRKANEEVSRMAADVEATARQHQQAFAVLDEECHRLTRENRELQLQVFKLGKDSREQAVGQGIYARLKQTKFDSCQAMYEDGNEEASLLLVMYQLEALENEAIDEFEGELFKSSIAEMTSWRNKFVKTVQCLLEEYHASDFRRHMLVRLSKGESVTLRLRAATGMTAEELEASATVGAFDPRQPDAAFGRRESALIMDRKPSVVGSKTSPKAEQGRKPGPKPTFEMDPSALQELRTPEQNQRGASAGDQGSAKQPEPDISRSRKLWAQGHFGNMYDRGVSGANALDHLWDSSKVFHNAIVAPLLDVSTSKFMTGIEVHAVTPNDTTFLRTINHIDPTAGVDLPPKTMQVRLKYLNPLMKPATGSADDERGRDIPLPSEWVAGLDDKQQQPKNTGSGKENASIVVKSVSSTDPAVVMAGAHWIVYKRKFHHHTPLMPRFMDIHHVDQLMLQVCTQHHQKLLQRFENCHEVAASRATGMQMARTLAERLFKEDFSPLDMQETLMDVLETRYVYPEVAMKVGYEFLSSLERHAPTSPYTRAYAECLAGATPPSLGFLLSLSLHLLATYWPVSPSQANEPIAERDLTSVLKGMYPSESLLKINIEELVNDIIISTKKEVTLNNVRDHIAASILNQREPVLLKLHEMFLFRAGAVHWSELDFSDFWETLKPVMQEEHHTPAVIKHIYACCVTKKPTRLSPVILSYIAAELLWMGSAKHRFHSI